MSWDDLQKPKQAARPEEIEAAREWENLHATVFGAGAGKALLAKYHTMVVDAVLAGEPSQTALVALNAQRQFVRGLETLTAKGIEAKPKGS